MGVDGRGLLELLDVDGVMPCLISSIAKADEST
jgi:hypothetical protein